MTYKPESPPASYDHRGLWCLSCDAQQSHYRAHKSTEPWRCTVCEHVEGEPVPEPEKGDHLLRREQPGRMVPRTNGTPPPMPAVQPPSVADVARLTVLERENAALREQIAAVTEEHARWKWTTDEVVQQLTADRDHWKRIAESAYKVCERMREERDGYRDKRDAMRVDRDQWKQIADDMHAQLISERDQWKQVADQLHEQLESVKEARQAALREAAKAHAALTKNGSGEVET